MGLALPSVLTEPMPCHTGPEGPAAAGASDDSDFFAASQQTGADNGDGKAMGEVFHGVSCVIEKKFNHLTNGGIKRG
jgi:hypothetical protein